MAISPMAFAGFSASVNQTHISINDVLELTLISDSDTSATPALDASGLFKSFEQIGSISQNRQYQIINGKSSTRQEWKFIIAPKKTGVLTIPAIALGKEKSQPITIHVSTETQNNQSPAASHSPVFINASLDQKQVYVQQQAVLTLKIMSRVNLYDDSSLTPLSVDNAIIQQLGDVQKYETVMEGTRYAVFELTFVIYPQKAGQLKIPPVIFTGTMANRRDPYAGVFSSSGTPVRTRSSEITLTVKPKPDNWDTKPWLPAKTLVLSDSWSQLPNDGIRVGDAITRTITLAAEGLTAAQLPSITMASINGASSYPDAVKTENIPTNSGMLGKQISATAIVPTRPGKIDIPPLKIAWFDTQENTQRYAEIPAKTLTVLPAINQPVAQPELSLVNPTSPNDNQALPGGPAIEKNSHQWTLWQIISLALGILWVLTVAALFLLRYKKSGKNSIESSATENTASSAKPSGPETELQNEAKAFHKFQTSCKEAKAPVILRDFKVWCRLFCLDDSLLSLEQCFSRLNNDEIKRHCLQIDASVYSGTPSSAAGQKLLTACKKIRHHRGRTSKQEETLAKLYPE